METSETNQAVIDLETGATHLHAPIFRIGVAILHANSEESMNISAHDFGVNPASCEEFGAKYDEDTVVWWTEQDPVVIVARDVNPRFHIKQALVLLNQLLEEHEVKITWGNSPSFDQSILLYYYKRIGLTPHEALTYRNQYDLRTIKELYPEVKAALKAAFSENHPQHIAINDAIAEMKAIRFFYNNIYKGI